MNDWIVIQSPTDPEMYAVMGVYLVADKLPIEDAILISYAPEMLTELKGIGHQTQITTEHFNRLQRLIENIEQSSRESDNE